MSPSLGIHGQHMAAAEQDALRHDVSLLFRADRSQPAALGRRGFTTSGAAATAEQAPSNVRGGELTVTARRRLSLAAVAAGAVVVVGGTSGIGSRLAETYAGRGGKVVITGRSDDRCREAAGAIDGRRRQLAHFDLAEPETIASAPRAESVRSTGSSSAAIERDENTVADYDVAGAIRLVTLKLVGYTEVVHVLADRLTRRRVDPALRRPGAAPSLPRIDDDHDGQRRRRGARATRSRWSSPRCA